MQSAMGQPGAGFGFHIRISLFSSGCSDGVFSARKANLASTIKFNRRSVGIYKGCIKCGDMVDSFSSIVRSVAERVTCVLLLAILRLCYILKTIMYSRLLHRQLLIAMAVVCLAPFVSAQDGLKEALSQTNLAMPVGHTLAVADLDGDDKADGAILLDSRWVGANNSIKIQLHFTGRPNAELSFESAGHALAVKAWDIDHDGDIDLVIEDAFTHRPLRVWINEGHGDFHEGRLQDYPSLALDTDKELQLPYNRPDCLALCVTPQRSFEVSMMTVHRLGRPPSIGKASTLVTISPFVSRARTSQPSRAPPL